MAHHPHRSTTEDTSDNDALLRVETIEYLQTELGFQCIDWLDRVDSTNSYARRLLEEDETIALPMLVVADEQTAGRGRGENSWWSSHGSLTFSILWELIELSNASQANIGQLALVTGLAVCDAVDSQLTAPCKIKWPNDLYVDDRKAGGILVEAIPRTGHRTTSRGHALIIGIGINVNVDFAQAPVEIQQRATSLSEHTLGRMHECSVLQSICTSVVNHIERWQNDDEYLNAAWPARCWLTGKRVEVEIANARRLTGICEGIKPSGELLVRDEAQRLQVILAGTVHCVPNDGE